ncbi:hypothetical protein XELAEV_18031968mg [Xenopus laevis]|uniref:Uncharacterized protein n=1 Tax=Xenopus laevis TaxID=8355 RepID=A0A974CNL2_XENLA|nr:hypothetical protein XELAEV_18031968mg [Xenopus laevis]
MFSSHLKLWLFLGMSIIWLLSTPVRSQEYKDYEQPEPVKVPVTAIAETADVLDKVTQAHGVHKTTIQPVLSKEDIYIIIIVALLALIVALSVGWCLHCRYMLAAENYKIGRTQDIDVEKGPEVPPAEMSQKRDPTESNKILSEEEGK